MLVFYINLRAYGQYHVVDEGCFPDQGHVLIRTTRGGNSPVVHISATRRLRASAFQGGLNRYSRDFSGDADAKT